MLVFVVLGIVSTILAGIIGTLIGFIPPRGDWTLRGARIWGRGILLGGLPIQPLDAFKTRGLPTLQGFLVRVAEKCFSEDVG